MKDAFERRNMVLTHFRGRVCRDDYDTNYRNILADGYTVRVLLNGRERPDWYMADSEIDELIESGVTFKGVVEIRLEK